MPHVHHKFLYVLKYFLHCIATKSCAEHQTIHKKSLSYVKHRILLYAHIEYSYLQSISYIQEPFIIINQIIFDCWLTFNIEIIKCRWKQKKNILNKNKCLKPVKLIKQMDILIIVFGSILFIIGVNYLFQKQIRVLI